MDTKANMSVFDGYIPLASIDNSNVLDKSITASANVYTDSSSDRANTIEVVEESKSTVASYVKEEPIEPTALNDTDIATFLENTSRKVLAEQNAELFQDVERYKDRCENLISEIARALDERNSAKSRISVLKKLNDDLKEKHSQETRRLKTDIITTEKEYRRKLDEARSDLKEESRLCDEARDALKDEQRLHSQSEHQIESLKRKVEKLEDMLASEHDRNKEYKLELEQFRGGMQNMMFQSYPMPKMPSFQRGIPDMQYPLQYPMHEFNHHYASIEHPTKRKANDIVCKRICYFGEKCNRDKCTFAHSIDNLMMCPNNISCSSKMRCGYMIHSHEERMHLYMLVQSGSKKVILCEEFDKNKTCKDGSQCFKIHKD